ncbi:MAG: hypothetical protein H7210_12285 [Pyrinomonadaceae bacterium]|nr:hypothetical protein [Phycisphaerales bacterium]
MDNRGYATTVGTDTGAMSIFSEWVKLGAELGDNPKSPLFRSAVGREFILYKAVASTEPEGGDLQAGSCTWHPAPRLTACTYTLNLLPMAATTSALPWVGVQRQVDGGKAHVSVQRLHSRILVRRAQPGTAQCRQILAT